MLVKMPHSANLIHVGLVEEAIPVGDVLPRECVDESCYCELSSFVIM